MTADITGGTVNVEITPAAELTAELGGAAELGVELTANAEIGVTVESGAAFDVTVENGGGIDVQVEGGAELNFLPDGALQGYYSKSETDALLAPKADRTELDARAPLVHIHDERYYTQQETDMLLALRVARSALLDLVYPVGAYYWSDDATPPGQLFGGDWEQITDTFLLAAGSTYTAGDTGGAASVTLTADEIPAHTHGSKTLTGWARFRAMDPAASDNKNMVNSTSGIVSRSADSGLQPGFRNSSGRIEVQSQYNRIDITATHEHTSVGGGESHENMPPYLAAYCWHRVG